MKCDPPRGDFNSYLLILDLWGISYHAVVVFGLGKNLLFKSILGPCVQAPKQKQALHLLIIFPCPTALLKRGNVLFCAINTNSRPYIYCFCQIFQDLLLSVLRLFRSLINNIVKFLVSLQDFFEIFIIDNHQKKKLFKTCHLLWTKKIQCP